MDSTDRLSLIYSGIETEKSKGKYFSHGQPTLFMSMNKRFSGETNPAYQRGLGDDDYDDNDDDDEDSIEEENLDKNDVDDNNSVSARNAEGSPTSRASKADYEAEQTTKPKADESGKTRPKDRDSDPDPYSEVPIMNGGPKVKVNFESLQESTSPPPLYQHPMKMPTEQSNEKKWDIFRTSAKESATSDEDIRFWNKVFVVCKLLICILLFFLVCGTAVISKLCFIIITSNIHLFPPGDKQTDSSSSQRHLLRSARGNLDFSNTGDTYSTNILWIWALVIIMAAPYLFIAGKCMWRLFFQLSKRKPVTLSTLIPILLIETLHSVGLIVIVFIVIPSLDPISGLLFILNIAVIPSVLKIWFPRTKKRSKEEKTYDQEESSYITRMLVAVLSFTAAVGQIGAIGLWCYHIISSEERFPIPFIVCVICAPIFVSATWWENYVHQGKKESTGIPLFAKHVRQRRTKLLLFTSLWKLVLLIVIPIAMAGIACDQNGTICIKALYDRTKDEARLDSSLLSFIFDTEKKFGKDDKCNSYLPLLIATVSILSSIVCFKTAKVACKIMTQVVDFSLPLVLSTPAAVGVVLGMYSGFLTTNSDGCALPFPQWNTTMALGSAQYFGNVSNHWETLLPIIAGLVGFLSFLLVSNHIWLPGKVRLQRTEMLFVQPLYCGIFTDQSLMLNRRRIETDVETSDQSAKRSSSLPLPEDREFDVSSNQSAYKTEETPLIYMCATMWHENENEMTQLLKSIFRMDEDQCTRKNYQIMFNRRDPDYYEFEAHIFFDDAFEGHKDNEYDFTVNKYVTELIKTVRVSAAAIMGVTFKMPDPKKVATPYGGRLVWSLPGGNQLVAHLKDKAIIRHRKRWSQVMYMYYFLGFKLLNEGLKHKKLEKKARNTFLLALDGDVDFHPPAVQLLVDRMKKNPLVGAACGRIHPIGNGAMVWYQKFEYAVSHWLQKAAEDKIGCVLCSPGCFSLFRGSALMDDNVMKRYTTPPSEPRHYVQYDQGEDRWLCTLLLQQGHRVEYCAASDALTFAPEGFYEFFNQRRRWTPSTLANIMDLLTDWKNVTRRNPEISVFYVFYQGLLLVSSILTPGTIFLLILGAINLAYPKVDLWVALIINIIPVAVMVVLCFISTQQVQLSFAGILSTAYSLVMMIVLVGLLRQAADYGFCSVTTVFLLFVAGVFVVSAFLHPQEFWCLLHGCLYFLAIPAMSMVLMLYSLGNLHVVSWGTRENKQPGGDPSQPQRPQDKVLSWLERAFDCCRGNNKRSEESALRAILDRLDAIEDNISTIGSEHTGHMSRRSLFGGRSRSISPAMMMQSESNPYSSVSHHFEGGGIKTNEIYQEEQQAPRDILRNPYWMTAEGDIQNFKKDRPLTSDEITFWRELIETYLKPMEGNEQHQKQTQEKLIELRNKVCLIFILINSLFIIVVFSLQQVTSGGGDLSVKLPCADEKEHGVGQSIEPISVAFTLVFGILLLVQFLCMLMHRFATMLHICASTTIFKGKKLLAKFRKDPESGIQGSEVEERAISFAEGYELVKQMQSNKDEDSISLASDSSYTPSEKDLSELEDDIEEKEKRDVARKRWRRIASRRKQLGKRGNTLNANFRRNFEEMQKAMQEEETQRKEFAMEGSDEENESDTVIGSFQKKPAFKGFNRKTLHVMARIQRNPSLKENIAKTKLVRSRWKVAKEQVLTNDNTRKKSLPLTVSAIIARNKLSQAEDDMSRVATCDSPVSMTPNAQRKDPAEISAEFHDTRLDSINRGFRPEIKIENADEDEENDADVTPSTSTDADDQTQITLQIPDVKDDEWPDEDQYVNDDTYVPLEDADTLF